MQIPYFRNKTGFDVLKKGNSFKKSLWFKYTPYYYWLQMLPNISTLNVDYCRI